jgi:hypothetical protein
MADYDVAPIGTLIEGYTISEDFQTPEMGEDGDDYQIILGYDICTGLETPDTTLPTVSNFSPVAGTTIEADDPLQFDVTDDSGEFARILVVAKYEDLSEELIHDGESFVGVYTTNSTRSLITNGFQYIVYRYGGWPSGVTIRVFAIDAAGNESV